MVISLCAVIQMYMLTSFNQFGKPLCLTIWESSCTKGVTNIYRLLSSMGPYTSAETDIRILGYPFEIHYPDADPE